MAQTAFILINSAIPSVSLGIVSGTAFTFSYLGTGEGVQFIPYTTELGVDGLMCFNVPNVGRSAVFSFAEIAVFSINNEDQLTGGSPATTLQNVADRCLPFFVEAGNGGGTLSGVGTFYVSAFALSGGNGSLERPFQTITEANTAAAAFFAANGFAVTIEVLPGEYAESFALSGNIKAHQGVFLNAPAASGFTSLIECNGNISAQLKIEGLSMTSNESGCVCILASADLLRLESCFLQSNDSGVALQVGGTASVSVIDSRIYTAGTDVAVMIDAGILSIENCNIANTNAGVPIDVQGGALRIYRSRIFGTGNWVTGSAGAVTIESFGNAANVAAGAGVTQSVGTATVSAALTVDWL